MAERSMRLTHPFAPIWDAYSNALILGTFPSVMSRENAFYYGHPCNRFWRVLASVFCEPVPETIAAKTAMLLRNHIALWDVLARCDISGSADGTIRCPVVNEIGGLLKQAPIKCIYVNGRTAETLYKRYCENDTGLTAIALPSTSPANAAWNEARLIEAWSVLAANEGE